MSRADNYRIWFDNGFGTMFISDPDKIISYDLIADLYAAFRKILKKSKYHLSVAGTFRREGNTEIRCDFFLDTAHVKKSEKENYKRTFRETYPYWGAGFSSLVRSIIFDIKHAEIHTEESKDVVTDRIFKHYISGLKARQCVFDDPVQAQINANRAKRKAEKARIKAEARAKALQKAAQQNSSHQG